MAEGRRKTNELLMGERQQIKPIDVINLCSNYRSYLYRRHILFLQPPSPFGNIQILSTATPDHESFYRD